MIRSALWTSVILAGLWCAWWALAAWGLHSGLAGWLEARRAEGWQAEAARIAPTGFPSEVAMRLQALALADPGTGLSLELDRLDIAARTLWPGDVQLALPATPIAVATPEGRGTLVMHGAQAGLNLHPGTRLELETLALTSGAFLAETPAGKIASGDRLRLAMVQRDGAAETYAIEARIDRLAPGDLPRLRLQLPADWPRVFSAFDIAATVSFDRPWDRDALEQRRPQPRRIELDLAEAAWGEMALKAAGAVDVDSRGLPSGKVTIKAENWQQMLELAQASGLLPADMRQTAENVLSSLAAGTGRTTSLDVTLTFQDGTTWLGFVPLGPAPRLSLR